MTDEMILACKLISPGQTLNLRRPRVLPPARDTRPIIVEEVTGDEDEEDEEDEVPLVRTRRGSSPEQPWVLLAKVTLTCLGT